MKKRFLAILISLFVLCLSNLALAHPLEGLDLPSLENGEMPTQNEIIDALYRAGRLPENFYDKMPESALTSREPARRSWDAEPLSPEAMREEMERRDAGYRRRLAELDARSERERQEMLASMEESLAEMEGTGETVGLRTACTCTPDTTPVNGDVNCIGTGEYEWNTCPATITGSLKIMGGCTVIIDNCILAVEGDIQLFSGTNELQVDQSYLTIGGKVQIGDNSGITIKNAAITEIEDKILAGSNTWVDVSTYGRLNFMDTSSVLKRIDMGTDSHVEFTKLSGIGCGVDSDSDGIGDEFCNGELISQGTGDIYIEQAELSGFKQFLHKNNNGNVSIRRSEFRKFSQDAIWIYFNEDFDYIEIYNNTFYDDYDLGALYGDSVINIRYCTGYIHVSFNTILDNMPNVLYYTGIWLYDSFGEKEIHDNIIMGINHAIFESHTNQESVQTKIYNNIAYQSGRGVYLHHTNNADVENNYCWTCIAGILISNSPNVEIIGIRDNYAELWNNHWGIYSIASDDLQIIDMEYSRTMEDISSTGVDISYSTNVIIEGFVGAFNQLGAKGIIVGNSSDVEIKYSRIQGFTDVGIELNSINVDLDPTENFTIYGNELISRDDYDDIVVGSIGIWVRHDKTGNDTYTDSQILCNDIQAGTGIRNESEILSADDPTRFRTGMRYSYPYIWPNRIWVPSTGGIHYDLSPPNPSLFDCDDYADLWDVTANCATTSNESGTTCLSTAVKGGCPSKINVTSPATGTWSGFMLCEFPEWW